MTTAVQDSPKKPRARNIQCPYCDRSLTPQGLAGHIRWQHADALGIDRKAGSPKSQSKVQRTLALVEQLRALRRQRDDLRAECKASASLFDGAEDAALTECLDVLELRELELRNSIRRLSGKPQLQRVETEDWFGDKRVSYEETTADADLTADGDADVDGEVDEMPADELPNLEEDEDSETV